MCLDVESMFKYPNTKHNTFVESKNKTVCSIQKYFIKKNVSNPVELYEYEFLLWSKL
jgi:hypothetical protein